MRGLVAIGLSVALLSGMATSAIAARPATHAETIALQRSARASLLFGDDAAGVQVIKACISTAEHGFAAVILHVPGDQQAQEITLFHRNPHLRPAWHMYGYASPQNLWFSKQITNPFATRLRAEHDLKANCNLPAWATKT